MMGTQHRQIRKAARTRSRAKTVGVALPLTRAFALAALLAATALTAFASQPEIVPGVPTAPQLQQDLKPSEPSSDRIDLSGDWKFKGDWEEGGLAQGWQKPEYDDSQWRTLRVPGSWEEQGVMTANPRWPSAQPEDGYNGYAWYRRHFAIPADWAGTGATLHVGAIDDLDWAYLNGQLIGSTTADRAWDSPRNYAVPLQAMNAGADNVIAIRVCDAGGAGGIVPGPVELLRATSAQGSPSGQYSETQKEIVNVGGGVEVPETTMVEGNVLAVGGSADVRGYVTGNVVAVGGSVFARAGSRIDGNATAVGGRVVREGDASIGGSVLEAAMFPAALLKHRWPSFSTFLVMLVFWGVVSLIAVFALQHRLAVMAEALPMHPGRAAAYGLLGFAFTPAALAAMTVIALVVLVVLAITIVGILLIPAVGVALLAVFLGLAALVLFGVVAVWLSLGKAAAARAGRPAMGALPAALLGLLIVALLSLLPKVGVLVVITVIIFGFGTAIMTGLGTHHEWLRLKLRRTPQPAAAPPPPPPPPDALT